MVYAAEYLVIVTWNSAVDRICLASGLHLTATKPADPSSILHLQSGCSRDQTF